MRTGTFHFFGKDYLCCFSAQVTTRLEAMHLKLSDLENLADSDAPVGTVLTILACMIDAGNNYAKLAGIDNPGTLSYDDLCAGLDITDLTDVVHLISEVVRGERHVIAEPPKNAEAPETAPR